MAIKILYVSMKNDYGDVRRALCYDYNHIYLSLVDSNYDCTFFDYMDYIKESGKEALQEKIKSLVLESKPDLVIFSLYIDQIAVETIAEVSKTTKTLGLFFDDTWRRDFVLEYGKAMHFFTTTDCYGETIYDKMNLPSKALYFSYGFNPKRFTSVDRSHLTRDVSFVGSWSSTREWIYRELAKSGFKLDFYGHGWKNGVLDNNEMIECFQKSKISLNLSNSVQDNLSYVFSSARAFKNYLMGGKKGEQMKGRHTEINACGGFQISFFANGLSNLYQIGKEIEVYQDIEDLKFKLDFYLEHEEKREEIAAAGLQRAQQYRYGDVMSKIFSRMGLNI